MLKDAPSSDRPNRRRLLLIGTALALAASTAAIAMELSGGDGPERTGSGEVTILLPPAVPFRKQASLMREPETSRERAHGEVPPKSASTPRPRAREPEPERDPGDVTNGVFIHRGLAEPEFVPYSELPSPDPMIKPGSSGPSAPDEPSPQGA